MQVIRAAITMVLTLIVCLNISLSAANAQPVEDDMCLVINKTRNVLRVYINNDPIYSFQIATGRGELTPVGEFKIANKIVNPWYLRKNIPSGDKRNPLGTRWMGISVPNTGGYRYGIHGTNAPYSIGHSVSSGCIRMRNKDIEWLYRHIGIGTRVIITK